MHLDYSYSRYLEHCIAGCPSVSVLEMVAAVVVSNLHEGDGNRIVVIDSERRVVIVATIERDSQGRLQVVELCEHENPFIEYSIFNPEKMHSDARWQNLVFSNDRCNHYSYDPYFDGYPAAEDSETTIDALNKELQDAVDCWDIPYNSLVTVYSPISCNALCYALQQKSNMEVIQLGNLDSLSIPLSSELLPLPEVTLSTVTIDGFSTIQPTAGHSYQVWLSPERYHPWMPLMRQCIVGNQQMMVGALNFKSDIYGNLEVCSEKGRIFVSNFENHILINKNT